MAEATKLRAQILKRNIRRSVSKRIYIKQVEKLEKNIEEALVPIFEKQVKSVQSRLLEIDSKKAKVPRKDAEDLAKQIANSGDMNVKEEIQDVLIPIMALSMLEAAKAQLLELGLRSEKSLDLKYNPYHGPDGRFTSGPGGGVHLAPDTGGGSGGSGGSDGGANDNKRNEARNRSTDDVDDVYAKLEDAQNLTMEQWDALEEYTGEFYETWNESLRDGGTIAELEEGAGILNKACQNKLNSEEIIYRGMRISRLEKIVNEGDIVKAKGFVSTSLNKDVAVGYSKEKQKAVMEIKAKTGVIAGNYGDEAEWEIVQAHGTEYRYLGKTYEESGLQIYQFEEM